MNWLNQYLVRNWIDFNRNVFLSRDSLSFRVFGDGVPEANAGCVQQKGIDDVLEEVVKQIKKYLKTL